MIIQDIFNAIALFLALVNGNSLIEDHDISFFNMTKNSINLLKVEYPGFMEDKRKENFPRQRSFGNTSEMFCSGTIGRYQQVFSVQTKSEARKTGVLVFPRRLNDADTLGRSSLRIG